MVMDQWVGEDLYSLATRISMLDPYERSQAGVRLYALGSGGYTPPISAEVVLAIAVMKQTGLL